MTKAEKYARKVYPSFSEDGMYRKDNTELINACIKGYEQAEKDLINCIRKQVETWMPERDGDEHTEGERLAFRSVLHLLEELEDEK